VVVEVPDPPVGAFAEAEDFAEVDAVAVADAGVDADGVCDAAVGFFEEQAAPSSTIAIMNKAMRFIGSTLPAGLCGGNTVLRRFAESIVHRAVSP
jgi:hypothetical protein